MSEEHTTDSQEDPREALRQLFARRLPSRIRQLRSSWHACAGASWNPDTASALQQRVERLASHAEVSEGNSTLVLLDKLNSILKEVTHTQAPPSLDQNARIEAAITALEQAAETREQEIEALPIEEPPPSHLVIISVPDPVLATEFKQQLTPFGYEIKIVLDEEAIKTLILQTPPLAIIMDASYLGEKGENIDRIKALQPEKRLPIPIIFLSSNEDLEMRLRCVRAGGEAFFMKPIEISSLIERLDVYSVPAASSPYRVLIVEDSKTHANYIEVTLQKAGMLTHVISNPIDVNKALVEFQPELILMDLYMPHCNGIELAKVIRQQDAYVSVPIVYLSSESDTRKQLDAMSLGGDDFLTKPIEAQHLILAVRSRGQRSRALRSLMVRDSLTGLLNHTRILDQLEMELTRSERQGSLLCFAMIDLDHFKSINDTYGHPIGDRVLKSLSRLLKQRLRRTDTVGRYGGEEFAVILPNTDKVAAKKVFEELLNTFSNIHHRAEDTEFTVTFSCGIAEFGHNDEEGGTVEHLCDAADKALYRAKEQGRNQVMIEAS